MAEAAITPAPPTAPAPGAGAVVTPPPDPRFVALAKKEEALVAGQQKLSSEKAQHAKDLQELAEHKKRMENALRDPDSYLRPVYGEKWIEKLNEYRLNANTVTPELLDQHIEKKLSALDQRLEDQRKKDKDEADNAAKAAADQQMTDWRNSVVEFVKGAPEYELINAYDAWGLVPHTIEAHFEQTKKLLSPKEAAEQVEKDLEERAKKTKKFGVQAAPKPGERPGSTSTTLTAAMTASTPGAQETAGGTWEDRVARAVKAAEAIEAQRKARQATQ